MTKRVWIAIIGYESNLIDVVYGQVMALLDKSRCDHRIPHNIINGVFDSPELTLAVMLIDYTTGTSIASLQSSMGMVCVLFASLRDSVPSDTSQPMSVQWIHDRLSERPIHVLQWYIRCRSDTWHQSLTTVYRFWQESTATHRIMISSHTGCPPLHSQRNHIGNITTWPPLDHHLPTHY